MSSLRPLREKQQVAMAMLRQSLMDGYMRPLLQAPCGFGKTVLSAHVVAGARRKHKRVTFCVPALTLVDQTFERFIENGIDAADMGVIQGDHPHRRPRAPIQIATAQTLARRDLPETDVVVVDECHIRFKVYEDWMADPAMVRVPFIGLTATPWTKGLGKVYDALLKPTSVAELIEAGWLSKFRVYAPSHPDLSGVKTVGGDYHEGQLAERMNKPELVADVVETWLRRGENRPTLCFATGRAHASALHDQFRAAGVAAAYVDANTPREEREEIGKALAAGAVKVVCNIGCLTTGIDWRVDCIILARPTKSENLFVQIIGRGLRIADGKADCVILDHSDTHLRLGMVTDIDADELDTGKKQAASAREAKDRMPLPKECTNCTGLVPAGVKECPCCGAVAKPPINVVQHDGELVEFGTGKKGPKPKLPKTIELLREMPKDVLFAQLRFIQQERGRKDGWRDHAYREITSVWPRGMSGVEPMPPDNIVRSWVRSKDIRWARGIVKSRGGAHA